MKKFMKRAAALFTAAMAIAMTVSMPVQAGSFSDAKEGVVYIESHFNADANVSAQDDFIWSDGRGSYFYQTPGTTMGFRASGFAIGNQGEQVQYIVTNAHVVLDDTSEGIRNLDPLNATMNVSSKKASEVLVYFSYGANDFMRAQIYFVDEEKDLCILKLPQATDKRKALILCKSANVDMDGDFAALGFPGDSDLGMDETSLAYGIDDITSTRGSISRQSTDQNGVNVYQIDIDISGGSSGGPLVNEEGQVVGINTYSVTDLSSGHQNNYAIVIDELLGLVDRETVPYTLSTDVSAETSPAETETSPAETKPASTETKPAQSDTVPVSAEAETSGSSDHTVLIVVIVIAVAVVLLAAVLLITRRRSSGSAGRGQRAENAPLPSRVGAETSRGAVITGMKGMLANKTFPIGGSIVMGRNSQKCNVCFPVDAQGISGVHCQIRQVNGGYEIVDLGSSNGTYLGSGQKLTPNVPVSIPDGTYFYLGSAEQLFQIKF